MAANPPRVLSELFIGRKQELEQFEKFLQSETKECIVNIHTRGEGGIGKTQLLQRMQDFCKSYEHVIFTEKLIDFYHTESHSKLGVLRQIVQNFGAKNFSDFDKLDELYQKTPDTSERENLLSRLEQAFYHDFAAFASRMAAENKLVVLFFDTYEFIQCVLEDPYHAESTEFSRWFETQLLPELVSTDRDCCLNNTHLVVSGRYPLNAVDKTQIAVQEVILSHFDKSESIKFLMACFKVTTPAKLADKIGSKKLIDTFHTLTGGRPILLALFADGVNYTRNPLVPTDLIKEIENKEGDVTFTATKPQKELFEKALIRRIASLVEPEDRAVPYMAIAYRRMTPEMFAFLLNLPLDEARDILKNKLKRLSFIKSKDQDIFLLHDEMRRMFLDLWWEKQDEKGGIRKEIAKKIVAFYEKEFLAQKELSENEREIYTSEFIEYALLAEPQDGLKRFSREFDIALQDGKFDYCDQLLREAEEFEREHPKSISFPEVLHIRLRRIRYYLSTDKDYELALKLADETLEQYKDNEDWHNSELHGHFLYVYGFAASSLKQFEEALNFLQQAKHVFFEIGEDYWLHRTENLLGYIYYRQGQFVLAEEALERSRQGFYTILIYRRELEEWEYRQLFQGYQLALGNLAGVYSYIGRFERAVRKAEITLTITRLLPRNNLEIARSYTTAGHVTLLAGDKINAERYLAEADTLSESIGNRLLQGRIKPNLAFLRYRVTLFAYLSEYYRAEEIEKILKTPISQEELGQAKQFIEDAIKILQQPPAIEKELADAYYALGELYMVTPGVDHWLQAEQAFEQALEWGRKIQFLYRIADTLESLVTLYYFWNGSSEVSSEVRQENDVKKQQYQAQLKAIDLSQYPELDGKYQITLGDEQFDIALALLRGQDESQLKRARGQDESQLKRAQGALEHAFRYYVGAVQAMQRFNEDRHYLALRVFYNRLKTLTHEERDGKLSDVVGKYLEELRSLWQKVEDLDLIYISVRLRLSPIDELEDKQLADLQRHIQQTLQRRNMGLTSILNACLIELYSPLAPQEEKNDHLLENFSLHMNAQADYYRSLNDDYQTRETIKIIRKELEGLQEPGIKTAIEGYTDCCEGTLTYRRGEYGRLLEIFLKDDLDVGRTRFDQAFPEARKKAFALLNRGERKLQNTLESWEQELSQANDEKQKEALKERIKRYRRYLGEARFRLGELLMLNGQFDNYTDESDKPREGALSYLQRAILDARDGEDWYRYDDAIQSYLNALYFSGKYDHADYREEFTRYSNELENTRRHPSIMGRLRIIQGDMLFSEYFQREDEVGGGYHYIIQKKQEEQSEKNRIRVLRTMWRYYVEACKFMVRHSAANFSATVRVLQRRLQVIQDVEALEIIGQGLPNVWNDPILHKQKQEELYTLVQFATIRSAMLKHGYTKQ